MSITESKLRNLIQDVLRESDIASLNQINSPSQVQQTRFTRPYRGSTSKEDLKEKFSEVIKVETSLHDMISHYREKAGDEISQKVFNAFRIIVSAMYEKHFRAKLDREEKMFIESLIIELIG